MFLIKTNNRWKVLTTHEICGGKVLEISTSTVNGELITRFALATISGNFTVRSHGDFLREYVHPEKIATKKRVIAAHTAAIAKTESIANEALIHLNRVAA